MRGGALTVVAAESAVTDNWGQWGRVQSPHRVMAHGEQPTAPFSPTLADDRNLEELGPDGILQQCAKPSMWHFVVSPCGRTLQWRLDAAERKPVGMVPLHSLVAVTVQDHVGVGLEFRVMARSPMVVRLKLQTETSADREQWVKGLMLLAGLFPVPQ